MKEVDWILYLYNSFKIKIENWKLKLKIKTETLKFWLKSAGETKVSHLAREIQKISFPLEEISILKNSGGKMI